VGDAARFATAEKLAGYVGTTPRVHASGGKTRFGRSRTDVNRYLKWAFVEASNAIWVTCRRSPSRHDPAALPELTDEAVIALSEVKGVGVWTTQMYLMFRLGRPDVLPALDFGIRNAMRLAYGLTHAKARADGAHRRALAPVSHGGLLVPLAQPRRRHAMSAPAAVGAVDPLQGAQYSGRARR